MTVLREYRRVHPETMPEDGIALVERDELSLQHQEQQDEIAQQLQEKIRKELPPRRSAPIRYFLNRRLSSQARVSCVAHRCRFCAPVCVVRSPISCWFGDAPNADSP